MPGYPYSIRDKHALIGGRIGYGKSTLIAYQAWNDMQFGEGGVAVIDPKGDLVDQLLYLIPDDRVEDCIWLDIDDPIPLDFMNCTHENEEKLVPDLRYILTKGTDLTASPNLKSNIDDLIYTLLEINRHIPKDLSHQRATFLDIYKFLEDEERKKFLKQFIKTPRYIRKWSEPLDRQDKGRILTRMSEFMNGKTIPIIFGDAEANLNMTEVIERKKILLVKVPINGGEPAKMYGSLLMAKIQQAAFSRERQHTPEDDRTPFYCFIDEFQEFQASEAFDRTLKMARSFKLCLTLACPQISDPKIDEGVRSALGIISTYILFHIAPKDVSFYADILGDKDPYQKYRDKAERLEVQWMTSTDPEKGIQARKELFLTRDFLKGRPSTVTVADALKLRKFSAIYKIGDADPVIEDTPAPPQKNPTKAQIDKAEYIKEHTRSQYGPNRKRDTFAEIGSNRSGDNYASHTEKPVLELMEDDERITPGTRDDRPIVLPHDAQKKGPEGPC